MGRKKQRKLRRQAIEAEETKSLPEINPDATLTPEASLDLGTSGMWQREDLTNVPSIGEREDDDNGYAETPSAIFDKYIGRLIPRERLFPFLLAFLLVVVAGWIFIQDNSAGMLKDFPSIGWTSLKIIIVLLAKI